MKRLFYLSLGWASVGLGFLGVVLPGLPTTPFLLVAAFAFGRSSPRLRAWLEEHPHLGQPILDWEERGAISPGAKRLAVGMMGLIFALSLGFGLAGWVLTVQAVCMSGATLFILTRPN